MICPKCNLDVKKVTKSFCFDSLTIYAYKCPNCEHPFAGTRYGSKKELLKHSTALPVKCSTRIQELSPKAYELYCDALNLKAANMEEFAGVGLRMALENLLFSYLSKEKGLSNEELKSLQLSSMIRKLEELEPETFKTACACIVRVFGNESVHIRKDFPPISFSDALTAYEFLCNLINDYIGLSVTKQDLESFLKDKKKKK